MNDRERYQFSFLKIPVMMRLSCNVGIIHELPERVGIRSAGGLSPAIGRPHLSCPRLGSGKGSALHVFAKNVKIFLLSTATKTVFKKLNFYRKSNIIVPNSYG